MRSLFFKERSLRAVLVRSRNGKSSRQDQNYFEVLLDEVVLYILSLLSLQTLKAAMQSCQRFYIVGSNNQLWIGPIKAFVQHNYLSLIENFSEGVIKNYTDSLEINYRTLLIFSVFSKKYFSNIITKNIANDSGAAVQCGSLVQQSHGSLLQPFFLLPMPLPSYVSTQSFVETTSANRFLCENIKPQSKCKKKNKIIKSMLLNAPEVMLRRRVSALPTVAKAFGYD